MRCLLTSGLLLGLLAGKVTAQSTVDKLHGLNRPDVPVQRFGSFVRRIEAVQANKADLSHFVVFLDEWYEGGVKLGPYGQDHLNHVAQRLHEIDAHTPPNKRIPVIVQPQIDDSLNQARREVVARGLLSRGVMDADIRVVIAHPQAEGLRYEDILRVYAHSHLYPQAINPYGGSLGLGGYGGGYVNGIGGYGGFGYGGYGYGGYGARPIIYGY
jgi:hypothetical protein